MKLTLVLLFTAAFLAITINAGPIPCPDGNLPVGCTCSEGADMCDAACTAPKMICANKDTVDCNMKTMSCTVMSAKDGATIVFKAGPAWAK